MRAAMSQIDLLILANVFYLSLLNRSELCQALEAGLWAKSDY